MPVPDPYSVIVLADAATCQKIVDRNTGRKAEPVRVDAFPKLTRATLPAQLELSDLQSGQRLCHLRQTGRCNAHRVEADVITSSTGKVNQEQPIRMKIHTLLLPETGSHTPARIYFDQVAFVAVNLSDGTRQHIQVEMSPRQEEETATTIPAATFVRAQTITKWKPDKPGRYQLYLSYRYADEIYEGRVEPPGREVTNRRTKIDVDDYFWGTSLLKIVYEDRLPCLVVNVKE